MLDPERLLNEQRPCKAHTTCRKYRLDLWHRLVPWTPPGVKLDHRTRSSPWTPLALPTPQKEKKKINVSWSNGKSICRLLLKRVRKEGQGVYQPHSTEWDEVKGWVFIWLKQEKKKVREKKIRYQERSGIICLMTKFWLITEIQYKSCLWSQQQ